MPDLTDRLRPEAAASGMEEELRLVSILLPVRDEEAALPETLDRLAKRTRPRDRMEILLVDGGSDDGTVRVAEGLASAFPRFRIAAFVEGHRLPDSNFIGRAVGILRSRPVDRPGRPIELEPAKPTPLARAERAGLRIYFSDRPKVRYVPRGGLRSLARQMLRYGRGPFEQNRKRPAALAAGSIATAAGRGRTLLPHLSAAFFTIHFGLGAGFLPGLFRRRPAVPGPDRGDPGEGGV